MSEISLKYRQSLSLTRWQRLCQKLGIAHKSAIDHEFKRIANAYGESQRAYHTSQHINECLALLDWAVEHTPIEPPWCSALEIALWYHDVVYQPQSSDNERRSVEQAIAFLQAHEVESAQLDCVKSLIMATCHLAGSNFDKSTKLTDWMLDIDLAILGASPQRFWQYNKQIRQEYAWVSETVYRTKRKAFLVQFLERSLIYRSRLFRVRFETQARENLTAFINPDY